MGAVKTIMGYLEGLPLPADKRACIAYAEKRGAPQDVVQALEKIPDRQFEDVNDLWAAAGSVA